MDVASLYERRFAHDLRFRDQMWQILCRDFFQPYVAADCSILELGAGYCEFINNIKAKKKIAVDLNPDIKDYAGHDVQVVVSRTSQMDALADGSADVAFASNFFEHLDREEILATIRETRRVLKKGGKFIVLQPNIRFCAKDYWMFFDHVTPIDDRALAEALETNGFHVLEAIPRFLPFTTKSRLPKSAFLVRAYLRLRPAWALFGQQSLVVSERV